MSFIKNLGPIQKRLLLVFAVVVLVFGGVGIYRLTHSSADSTSSGTIPVKEDSSTKNARKKDASGNTAQTNSNKPTSPGVQGSTSGELVAPSGSFVSNHRPGQNGSNLAMESQCVTTPGATCYIKLAQGGTVKTLPAKTVDASGSVFWEWNVNDAGLTKGSWTVTAIASLGDQTKSTTDQLALEVQ